VAQRSNDPQLQFPAPYAADVWSMICSREKKKKMCPSRHPHHEDGAFAEMILRLQFSEIDPACMLESSVNEMRAGLWGHSPSRTLQCALAALKLWKAFAKSLTVVAEFPIARTQNFASSKGLL